MSEVGSRNEVKTEHESVKMKKKANGLKVCNFLQGCYDSSQRRFMAIFFKEKLLLTDSEIGRLLSLYYVASIISTPFFCFIADNFFGRRAVFLGTTLFALVYLLIYMAFDFNLFHTSLGMTIFFSVRFLNSFFASANKPLLDSENLGFLSEYSLVASAAPANLDATAENGSENYVILVAKKERNMFGKWRSFETFGWAFCSLLIGILLDATGHISIMFYVSSFFGAFLLLFVFKFFSFTTIFSETASSPMVNSLDAIITKRPFRSFAMTFVSKRANFVFIVTMFFLSAAMILVEQLLFLYFVEDLKLSYTVCGFASVITGIFEVPIFYFANIAIEKFGLDMILVFGMFCYATRVYGYTIVPNGSLLILAFEWLHGFTIASVQTASTLKISNLSPKGSETTYQGISQGIFAAGAFTGEVLGGYGFQVLGKRATYRIAALTVAVNILIFLFTSEEVHVFRWLYMRSIQFFNFTKLCIESNCYMKRVQYSNLNTATVPVAPELSSVQMSILPAVLFPTGAENPVVPNTVPLVSIA